MSSPQRTPVSTGAVVEVALDLMADGGLEAVSFRRIAAELGVSAPTLYWHVESKRQLMDLMADELMQRTGATPRLPAPGEPWWDWLREHATLLFEALTTTRDAPRVLAGNRPLPESYAQIERALRVLVDAGLSPVEAQMTLFAIGSYVIGSATEWQAEADRAAHRPGPDVDDDELAARRAEDLADHPVLLSAINELLGTPHPATFTHGLDLLIGGLRARYPG